MMQGLLKSSSREGLSLAFVAFSSRFQLSLQSQSNPLSSPTRLLLPHFTALSRRMSDDQMSLLASDKIKIDSREQNFASCVVGGVKCDDVMNVNNTFTGKLNHSNSQSNKSVEYANNELLRE